MFKPILIALTILVFVLTACSPMAAQYPELTGLSPEASNDYDAPREAPAPEGGQFAIADEAAGIAERRIVIKEAQLEIVVADPPETLDMISQLANEMGGYVVSAYLHQTRTASGEEYPRATITIRVPSERLDEALSVIEDQSDRLPVRRVNSQDVTSEYTDLQSRLRNLEAAEDQLIRIMESASRTEDVLNVHRELTNVREQIELIKGKIQYYDQSSQLSSITVDILPKEAILPITIAGWEPVGVARDALQALVNVLQFLVDALIWIGIVILPVTVVVMLPIYLLVRLFLRKRSQRKASSVTQSPS
ncbi:MAG: DUF4349 domain-containing protein [Anaerolineales bacterium]|nr:DUF4349 domain-containing protein [Anaerolineales bacterium]